MMGKRLESHSASRMPMMKLESLMGE
jgi:hypothetical protein